MGIGINVRKGLCGGHRKSIGGGTQASKAPAPEVGSSGGRVWNASKRLEL